MSQVQLSASFEIKQPLSNIQMELLKVYAGNLPDTDVLAIRKLLAKYFAEKATEMADEIWEEKGLSDAYFLDK